MSKCLWVCLIVWSYNIFKGPALSPTGWLRWLCFSGPGFCQFRSWVWTWHCSSGHAEVVSHMPQLEGPTTKNIQLCTRGFGEKKENKIFKLGRKSWHPLQHGWSLGTSCWVKKNQSQNTNTSMRSVKESSSQTGSRRWGQGPGEGRRPGVSV